MSCSRAEHTIEYLKPSQLFRETMKRGCYHNPAFLGFSFTDEYVRVAISDDCYAWIHSEFPRDKTHLDKLVEVVQGIQNSSFGRAPFGFLFWRKTIYSELHERLEVFSAQNMLQNFIDFFCALYMDEDEELEDKDEEMEDSKTKVHEDIDLEMEDSETQMIKYLKPLQFYQEAIVRDYDIPVLPGILGLSFTDKEATVGYSIDYCNAQLCGIFRRDETLLDTLVEVFQSTHIFTVLTSIGNFCICSISVGMILEIIVVFPIQQRSYRDGIKNLLVLLIDGIPIAMPTVLSVTLAIGSHRLSQQVQLLISTSL
ncbi:hypothetical protein LWI29_036149 [Acer saccharum]|uniref:Uncharacterized protein n=1 Tax=Acer saccharum TaxID=4024 RepID=A0AA39SXW2_ACESA|nr:hypothetical protein LWI29_036149 [Acer saccharum]